MFVEQSADEQYKVFCAEILEPTFKEIALTFSVSTSEFYNTVHELSFSPERLMSEQASALGVDLDFDDIQGYDRILEIEKSKQRLYRIAERLTINPDENNSTNSDILTEPKVYDEHIYDMMAMTYGRISDLIGDSLFNKLGRVNVVRALQIEGRKEKQNDKVFFSFSEFTMFTCLYMALNRASVGALNKHTETANYKKRLKGRMRQIKQWLFSEQLRDALVRTLLDLLTKFNEEKYSLLLDKHLRDHWLPEEKRHIKYLDYAEKKAYFLQTPRITYQGRQLLKEEGRNEKEIIVSFPIKKLIGDGCERDEYDRIRSFLLENKQVQMHEQFFCNVLPVVTMISEGLVPKGLVQGNEQIKEIELQPYLLSATKLDRITKAYVKRQRAQVYTIHPNTYQVAEKVCEVINTYVDAAICSVGRFLECLPESRIRGEKDLLVYFEEI